MRPAPAPAAASASLAAAAVALAAACSSPPAAGPRAPRPPLRPSLVAPAAPETRPRLVVLLVVDQLPAWAFTQKRPHLTGGFDRLLREGDWHTGEHPSAATVTAVGHAVISTGEPPATSGILSNEWYRRAYDRVLRSVEDPDGGVATARWLRAPGLADAIVASGANGKAVSVSLKDRSAILMLGRAGTPIWYDRKAVAWTSTAAPGWLAEHNRRAPLAARLKDRWSPLDASRLAELSGTTDDQPGEIGTKGLDATFPHDLARAKDPADALYATPAGNQIVLDAGLAAIDGEELGRDAAPDLLALSLSAHDYVGHGWGQESWEAWDMMLRLDEQLGRFLDALDQKVGAGRWAMLVTSDHGASPLPERAGGGRITYESIKDSANRAAATALGLGDWIADAKFPSVYLSAAARARSPRDQARAIQKIVYALRSFPGLARVERTADFAGRCETRTGTDFLFCLALDPAESGEVFYMPARGWILQEAAEIAATAHGSHHAYDREVPLILVPPDRKPHPPHAAPSAAKLLMVRVPVILARWLGVPSPPSMPR